LARRLYDKMREQTVAVKILQRNIRAWLELQNWGWWNLYVKARPMITTRNFAKEIEELQAEVKELKRALAEAQADRDKVSKERSDAESEIELLAAKLKQLEANLSDLLGALVFILFFYYFLTVFYFVIFYFILFYFIWIFYYFFYTPFNFPFHTQLRNWRLSPIERPLPGDSGALRMNCVRNPQLPVSF